MQGKIWVMITFSRQSAERFSQNSVGRDRKVLVRLDGPVPLLPLRHPPARFWLPAPTFDLVGGCGPHLGLTVLHQVLEGRYQICLGDLRPHCFLELYIKRRETLRAWQLLRANKAKTEVKAPGRS